MSEFKNQGPSRGRSAILAASNWVVTVTSPRIKRTEKGVTDSHQSEQLGRSLNTSISGFKALKEMAEVIPVVGAGLKASCGIMIMILETVKQCKENREAWEELVEIMTEKNECISGLLRLYEKAPNKYPSAEKQAKKYQQILDTVSIDIKKETQKKSEASQGLEMYWSRIQSQGREAVLAKITAERIGSYREKLRNMALDVIEKTMIDNALVMAQEPDVKTTPREQSRHKGKLAVLKPIPRIVEDFVGRQDILDSMCNAHFSVAQSLAPRGGPIVTVLTGMGGSGKTQIAAKFASLFEKQLPAVPVFFVDASSEASLQADMDTLLRSQSDSYNNASVWLENGIKDWLLIIDNADDPSLKLSRFLPRCTHGHVVITTRDATRKVLAPRSTHAVDVLSMEDSITLILVASGSEDNESNRTVARDIAEELGGLPLAMAHAAAYILINNCLDTFMEIYGDSRGAFLQRNPDLPQDYPHSVQRTIEISFHLLSPRVRDMLELFAYLDALSIPQCIIKRAARRKFAHIPQTREIPPNPDTVKQGDALLSVFCSNGEWNAFEFDAMIGECLNYSLLRFSIADGEKFYSMHPLVQKYLRSLSSIVHGYLARQIVVRLLASTITTGRWYEHFGFNRLLAPHVRLIRLEDVTEAGDHYGFGSVLAEVGDALGTTHLRQCIDMWKSPLCDESDAILDAMTALANFCQLSRRWKDAVPLQEAVLAKRRELLGPDHIDTLMAMHKLANTYNFVGRSKEAVVLQEEVLGKWKGLLGSDHLDTISAMHTLASSYLKLGREKEALALGEVVLTKRRGLLGPEHPDTLLTMHNLACNYLDLGRGKEALALEEEVLAKRRELLGPDHPDTLHIVNNLAKIHLALGRKTEALVLGEEVLMKQRELLGPDHLDTLNAMHNLAYDYSILGREMEALALREEVLEKRINLLGPEDRDTLDAAYSLLLSLRNLAMYEELKTLGRSALPLYEKIYGFDHKDTVWIRRLFG
ncbi:hypothetical protein FRC14_003048 [Serendipita sp. 396]|nr:hypothetical protein FRC14_003048 [Serendipita sp. 396]